MSFIAEGALVVGDVTLGEHSSVWFHSVLRGDVAPIVIKDRSNIQDGTIIHVGHNQPSMHAPWMSYQTWRIDWDEFDHLR